MYVNSFLNLKYSTFNMSFLKLGERSITKSILNLTTHEYRILHQPTQPFIFRVYFEVDSLCDSLMDAERFRFRWASLFSFWR